MTKNKADTLVIFFVCFMIVTTVSQIAQNKITIDQNRTLSKFLVKNTEASNANTVAKLYFGKKLDEANDLIKHQNKLLENLK